MLVTDLTADMAFRVYLAASKAAHAAIGMEIHNGLSVHSVRTVEYGVDCALHAWLFRHQEAALATALAS